MAEGGGDSGVGAVKQEAVPINIVVRVSAAWLPRALLPWPREPAGATLEEDRHAKRCALIDVAAPVVLSVRARRTKQAPRCVVWASGRVQLCAARLGTLHCVMGHGILQLPCCGRGGSPTDATRMGRLTPAPCLPAGATSSWGMASLDGQACGSSPGLTVGRWAVSAPSAQPRCWPLAPRTHAQVHFKIKTTTKFEKVGERHQDRCRFGGGVGGSGVHCEPAVEPAWHRVPCHAMPSLPQVFNAYCEKQSLNPASVKCVPAGYVASAPCPEVADA